MSSWGIRVIVTDDDDLVRTGLAALLKALPGLEVVGEAGDGLAAVQLCDKIEVDVVLMDLGMPRMGGISATRTLGRHHPGVQVVAMIGHGEEELLGDIMRAGAAGYVFKSAPVNAIAEAIRAAAACGSTAQPSTSARGRSSARRTGMD